MIVDTPAELADLFADVLFSTATAAALDADIHMSYPATVWRLPTGQYVWATTDTEEVFSDWYGVVRLRDLCIGAGDPVEVMTRDFGTWDVVEE